MALIKCPECGKEISDKASSCPNCGCPIEIQRSEVSSNISDQPITGQSSKKSNKKIIPIVIALLVVAILGIVVYNVKVVQPRKLEAQNKATYEEAVALLKRGKYEEANNIFDTIPEYKDVKKLKLEAQNKATYEEAIGLLEKGKYEDGNELLKTITGYKDVDVILEQIKWESRVYECITDIRQYLKNPDSLQVYEVVFYDGYKSDLSETKKTAMKDLVKLGGGEPICVMHRGGQNGFGGNTTGYSVFLCSGGVYKYLGSCESLDEDKIDDDDEEEAICGLINLYKDNLETVGDVDLTRIKTIIKNDSYSTIKIIE